MKGHDDRPGQRDLLSLGQRCEASIQLFGQDVGENRLFQLAKDSIEKEMIGGFLRQTSKGRILFRGRRETNLNVIQGVMQVIPMPTRTRDPSQMRDARRLLEEETLAKKHI